MKADIEARIVINNYQGFFSLLCCVFSIFIGGQPAKAGGSVTNGVVGITISGINGGSIDSLKILGTEVIDAADLGREIQASVFFLKPEFHLNNHPGCLSSEPAPPWFNPQDGGDMCGKSSVVTGFSTTPDGYINVISQSRDYHGVTLWDEYNSGSKFLPEKFIIEGHHKLGPLPYSNHKEIVRLFYIFRLESSAPTDKLIFATNQVTDSNGHSTPTSFVPAIYFKNTVLTRLFGLSLDGSTWHEVTPNTSNGQYTPSIYHYRSMAWMTNDLGWGVGVYGRSTLAQSANYSALHYPALGVNSLNLINQSMGTLTRGQEVGVLIHLVVGNLETIKGITNEIYKAGQ